MNKIIYFLLIFLFILQDLFSNDMTNHIIWSTNYVSITPWDLMDKVNTFYSDSWNKVVTFLTFFVSLVVAIFGVFIPLIQSKSLKEERELLKREIISYKNDINNVIDDKITDAKNKINDMEIKSDSKLKNYENKIERVNANTLFLQGTIFKEAKNYYVSLYSFLSAAKQYISINDIDNTKKSIRNIIDCLANVNKDDLKIIYDVKDISVDQLIDLLKKNDNIILSNLTKSLEEALNNIKD